jgi:hypothetical protein
MSERIAEVEWVDTLTKHGWLAPADVPTKPWLIHSVGYVFQDDAEGIVLLEARGDSENSGERMKDCGCATMIPRSAIRKVTELRRGRRN